MRPLSRKKIAVMLPLVVATLAAVALPVFAGEREDLLLATKAFNDHLYDMAAQHARAFVERYPASSDRQKAEFILGSSTYEAGKYKESVETFTGIIGRAGVSDYHERALLMIGKSYWQMNDPALAAKQYEDLIRNFPNSALVVDAEFALAGCLAKQGLSAEAEEMYEGIVVEHSAHPLSAESLFRIGELQFERQNYASASKTIERFLAQNPVHARSLEAYYLLGESYRSQGDYQVALQSFKKVLSSEEKGPFHAYVLNAIAWTYFQMGKYAESLEAFTPFVSDVRGSAVEDSFLFGRARALDKLKRHDDADQAYLDVMDRFKDSTFRDDAFLWLSESYIERGNYPEAQKALERMLAEYPKSDLVNEARYNLAWALLKMDEDAAALSYLRELAEGKGSEALIVRALCTIGDVYVENGLMDQAIVQYDKALKAYPTSAFSDYAQYQLASLLLKAGKIDGAILGFRALNLNFPGSAYRDDALYALGVALMRAKNFHEASGAFSELVNNYPESPFKRKAFFQRGVCLYNTGRHEEALKIFERLESDAAVDPELSVLSKYQIALIYFKTGRDTDAVGILKAIDAEHPTSRFTAEVLYLLGEHFFERGNYAEAKIHFAEVARRFPSHPVADDASFLSASAALRSGDIGEAADAFGAFLEAHPSSDRAAVAVDSYVEILIGQGKGARAKEELLKRKDAFVSNPRAAATLHRRLAEMLRIEGSLREALVYYNEALKGADEKDAAQIRYGIGETMELEGRKEEAAAEFVKVESLYPAQTQIAQKALKRAGQLYEEAGRKAEAEKIRLKLSAPAQN